MKLIQWTGPFSKDQKLHIDYDMNYKIMQIGISCPDTWPIEFLALDNEYCESINGMKYCDIKINGKVYHIDDLGILEFSDLAETYLEIEFLRDLPFGTIIDVSYEQMEEQGGAF